MPAREVLSQTSQHPGLFQDLGVKRMSEPRPKASIVTTHFVPALPDSIHLGSASVGHPEFRARPGARWQRVKSQIQPPRF